MTVAFDAFSEVAAVGTGTLSWTHTPVGTAKGVLVYICQILSTSDSAPVVTYGGVSVPVKLSVSQSTAEVSRVWSCFIGTGIPTGAQTVQITFTGTISRKAYCLTYTSDGNCAYLGSTLASTSANPSISLALAGETCAVSLGAMTGATQDFDVAPTAGWTTRDETESGDMVSLCYTYNTVASTTPVACGLAVFGEKHALVAMGIYEIPASMIVLVGSFALTGKNSTFYWLADTIQTVVGEFILTGKSLLRLINSGDIDTVFAIKRNRVLGAEKRNYTLFAKIRTHILNTKK